MANFQIKNPEKRQWRMLLVYDLYRILSIAVFLGIYFLIPPQI